MVLSMYTGPSSQEMFALTNLCQQLVAVIFHIEIARQPNKTISPHMITKLGKLKLKMLIFMKIEILTTTKSYCLSRLQEKRVIISSIVL